MPLQPGCLLHTGSVIVPISEFETLVRMEIQELKIDARSIRDENIRIFEQIKYGIFGKRGIPLDAHGLVARPPGP